MAWTLGLKCLLMIRGMLNKEPRIMTCPSRTNLELLQPLQPQNLLKISNSPPPQSFSAINLRPPLSNNQAARNM